MPAIFRRLNRLIAARDRSVHHISERTDPLLVDRFLAVHDVQLVASPQNDRAFAYFSGFEFVDVCGRIAFAPTLAILKFFRSITMASLFAS